MTKVFICRKCAQSSQGSSALYTTCAYLNSSSAFPANIIMDLKCPCGYEPNWEYVEKSTLFIPVNFKSSLTQEDEKKKRAGECMQRKRAET